MGDRNTLSALREGHSMRALPLVPKSSLLSEIPIVPRAHSQEPPLAARVYNSVRSYNNSLKLVQQPGESEHWGPSADVVRQGFKINEVVQRAFDEIQPLVSELERRVDRFTASVPLQAHHFRDGSWARKLTCD